jgi:hypothetical protein
LQVEALNMAARQRRTELDAETDQLRRQQEELEQQVLDFRQRVATAEAALKQREDAAAEMEVSFFPQLSSTCGGHGPHGTPAQDIAAALLGGCQLLLHVKQMERSQVGNALLWQVLARSHMAREAALAGREAAVETAQAVLENKTVEVQVRL